MVTSRVKCIFAFQVQTERQDVDILDRKGRFVYSGRTDHISNARNRRNVTRSKWVIHGLTDAVNTFQKSPTWLRLEGLTTETAVQAMSRSNAPLRSSKKQIASANLP